MESSECSSPGPGPLSVNNLASSILALVCTYFIFFSSCKKVDDILCDPTPQFNIDLFVQNLHEAINDPGNPVAGYQIAVNQNGNLYHSEAGGKSIYSADPGGPIPMKVTTRMNVASVSKFIGTIAMMQVMEKHGINIESLVYDYLPESWKGQTHPDHYLFNSAYAFTFRNMMRMETGLAFAGDDWSPGIMPTTDQMLEALSKPAAPNRWGVYQNGDFTLIRVLIGELEYGLNASDPDYNKNTTDAYFDYIRKNIFNKLDLSPPLSVDEVNDYYANTLFTRAHQYPFDSTFTDSSGNLGWAATSDPILNAGSGGLVLSCMDLARILAYFRHDNVGTIISIVQRNTIMNTNNLLGLIETTTGEHGTYHSKGGTRGPESGTKRALRSRIMFFPNGVEVVLLVNSNHTDMGGLLKKAYDDAWVDPCD